MKQNKWKKKLLSIDPNVKGAISESFDKSHLSESFDVPAGCKSKITRDVYERLIKDETNMMKYLGSWERDNIELNLEDYRKAFTRLYQCTKITKFRDFQYRLLLNKLVFNEHLVKWGKETDNLCGFCKLAPENFKHIYSECVKTSSVFKFIQDHFRKTGEECQLEIENLVLNNCHPNPHHIINWVVLIAKQYIYMCRCKNQDISVEIVCKVIEDYHDIDLFEAKRLGKIKVHIEKWHNYKPELAKMYKD